MQDAGSFETAVVIGGGTMGRGIAQVAAMAGLETTLVDLSEEVLDGAYRGILAALDKGVDRGKLNEQQRGEAVARLATSTDLGGSLPSAQVVIEAVPESLELKRRIFAQLGELCGPSTLLATNTSSLPIGEIASAAAHPERVVMQAVKRMLPGNRLSRQQMTNLRVYAGAEHPHEAQNPEVLDVKSMNSKNTRG